MGYISAQQAATKWGISKRRVQVLCTENRIKNATRIGNMWVVPEDALKPADGRVQTHHTVESPTARAARTALKKLTVNAYQEINGKLNNPSTSKMVFVSLLATTIFCDIQNDESSNEKDDVFLMISSELLEIEFKESSRRSFWEMFSSLVSDFEKYIYRYADQLALYQRIELIPQSTTEFFENNRECIINNWPEESALAAKPEILYDALLASEFCVQPERVGYKIDKVSRDIAGAYYTSSDFSAQITYRALESYMDRKRRRAIDSDSFACCNEYENITFLDYSCGCGEFLLAVIQYFDNHVLGYSRKKLATQLRGVDVNPIALMITIARIVSAVEAEDDENLLREVAKNFIVGNPLLHSDKIAPLEVRFDNFALNRLYAETEGINCLELEQAHLVGSGAKNLITQNSNEPIDLDYNLMIIDSEININNCREIKEYIRKQFNVILNKNGWNDCMDSTSVLTTEKRHFTKGNHTEFSIDLAIVFNDRNGCHRLIHEKTGFTAWDRYYWNLVPNSRNLFDKVAAIKDEHLWDEVIDEYLEKKNMYLRRQDYNHPSFNVYVETVNQVFNKYFD